MTNDLTELKVNLTPYLNEIFARKAERVAAIDVRKLTSYTDAIIVITAVSSRTGVRVN